MRCTPIARAKVTVGSSPSGTFATMIPMAKIKAAMSSILTARVPSKKKTNPMPTARKVIRRVIRAISFCNGLSFGLNTLGQVGDLAKLRIHPGADHDHLASPRSDTGSGKSQIAFFGDRAGFVVHRIGGLADRHRFAGEGRIVGAYLEFLDEAAIRRDIVTLGQQQDIPGDQIFRQDFDLDAVPQDPGI